MPKQKLFDDDSEEEVSLKTENEYAKKYDKWREKEELHKLEQKYGSKSLNSDGSISTDSEDESDEPPEVSEETEKQFLKTLALLKTKDPRIYDPNYKCFDDSEKKEKEKDTKPKTLTFADSDDDEDDDGNIFSIEKKAEIAEDNKKPRKTSETKVWTDKKHLTKKTVSVIKNDVNGTGGGPPHASLSRLDLMVLDIMGDGFGELQTAARAPALPTQEGKIKEYLTGQAEHIDDEVEKDLAPLKALWSDPKLNEGEAFLRDYILNKRYLEDGDAGEAEDKIRDDEELEADEERVEEQGKFERAYNFRFEEPDQEYLKRFPRTMNYIRPKDDRRSRKRAEVRTRKEEEKQRKMEEIARLKALKLKEIQEKIAKIKEVTGNEDLAFKEEDLESEFDPDEHDKRMKEIFDEEYYGDADEQKPVFPDLDEELEIENWDNYQPEQEQDVEEQGDEGAHCEDEDFNMDADYDPKKARENLLEEVKKTLQGKKRRNRKKKSKLAQLLETEKPKFVPTVEDKSYNEYMEEYYKMDCEDVIGGDLPTRFKYREVVPNDYGLSIEEILLADDKELTQWVPLKKILKYRPDNVEKGDAKNYAQKAADTRLKKKILPSLFKDLPEEPEIVVPIETTKKKKKNKNKDAEVSTDQQNTEGEVSIDQNDETSELVEEQNNSDSNNSKKKKHKKNKIEDNTSQNDIQEDTEANGEIKENKKKKKHKVEGFIVEDVPNAEPSQESAETVIKDKKRKKDKRNSNNDAGPDDTVADNKKSNDNTNDTSSKAKQDNKQLKRKAETADTGPTTKKHKGDKKVFKKNFKQNGGLKNKTKGPVNPLVNLSDERLKAYGLNPKKYKNFLHFKKY